MNQKSELRMKKAHESLAAAELLLKNSYVDIAASRGYYAMFYAAEALLYTRGLEFRSHKAVIGNFGREFAKTGDIDPSLHRHLIEAERVRHAGDYGQGPLVTEQEAAEILARAKLFLAAAEAKLFTSN